jgi:hypothetical protein
MTPPIVDSLRAQGLPVDLAHRAAGTIEELERMVQRLVEPLENAQEQFRIDKLGHVPQFIFVSEMNALIADANALLERIGK